MLDKNHEDRFERREAIDYYPHPPSERSAEDLQAIYLDGEHLSPQPEAPPTLKSMAQLTEFKFKLPDRYFN